MTRAKVLLLTMGLLATPRALDAQFALGPLGGFNLADVRGNPQNYSSREGITGGALMNARISGSLSIQPEFYYTQKGADGDTENGTEVGVAQTDPDTVLNKLRLNYFEFTPLVRLTTGGEAARLYVLIGPALAGRLACSIEITDEGNIERLSDCEDEQGNGIVRSVDYSLVGGFGLDLKLPGTTFDDAEGTTTIDFRIINGWRSLTDDGPTFLESLKNRAFAFSIRYPIGSH